MPENFPTVTYTYGLTPVELIRSRMPGRYAITLSRSDEPLFMWLFSLGIDAHLEGFTDTKQSRETGNILGNRLQLDFSAADMLVLLRRLLEESEKEESKFADDATSWRISILGTLDIEEV